MGARPGFVQACHRSGEHYRGPSCGVPVVDVDRRAEIRRVAGPWAERTAVEQGLPATVEDETTLQEVATLLSAGRDRSAAGSDPPCGLIGGSNGCARARPDQLRREFSTALMTACWRARGRASYVQLMPSGFEDAHRALVPLATVQGCIRGLDARLDGCRAASHSRWLISSPYEAASSSSCSWSRSSARITLATAGSSAARRRIERRGVGIETVYDSGGDERVDFVGKDERAATPVAAGIAGAHIAAATVAARARDEGRAAAPAAQQPSEQVLARHPIGAALGVTEQRADASGLRGLDDGGPGRLPDDLAVVLALPTDARAVQQLANAVRLHSFPVTVGYSRSLRSAAIERRLSPARSRSAISLMTAASWQTTVSRSSA